jgi:hypothetical protein
MDSGDTLDKQITAGNDILAKVKLRTPSSQKPVDIANAYDLHPEAAMAAWFAELALGSTRGFGTLPDFFRALAIYQKLTTTDDRLASPNTPA